MRLLVINPNTTDAMTRGIEGAARLYAHPDTEIVAVQPKRGPRSIEGHLDALIAAQETVSLLLGEADRFDAAVIACFDDPGLYAAREAVEIPVIGIAEAAMLMACTLGHSFSILTLPARGRPATEELVRRYGLEHRCASIRTIDLPILEIEEAEAQTRALFYGAGRRALEEDGADVLVLGCAGLAHLDKELGAELGVPVLDGVACAVKMAEACVGYGVRTSKYLGFAPPPSKEYVGYDLPSGVARR